MRLIERQNDWGDRRRPKPWARDVGEVLKSECKKHGIEHAVGQSAAYLCAVVEKLHEKGILSDAEILEMLEHDYEVATPENADPASLT